MRYLFSLLFKEDAFLNINWPFFYTNGYQGKGYKIGVDGNKT